MTLLHRFKSDISVIEVPRRFNNPFYYMPHALCMMAADEVRTMLLRDSAVAADAARGKMFGVLVVRDSDGSLGYLAAFSGLLAGSNDVAGFVPPVFDLLLPGGYFRQEESEISALNKKIKETECCDGYVAAVAALADTKRAMELQLAAMREDMRLCREHRSELRASASLTADEEAALVRESQFQKAELKRATARWQRQIAECEEAVAPFKASIMVMKEERKRRSAALQRWLFEQFKVLNANGCEKSLLDIFAEHSGIIPPAGAGECAAPKLLQYAYLNSLTPIAVSEFWVGESPTGEVRRDGCFYGSCTSKCRPILSFMLQGMDVEDEFALQGGDVEILYEDDYLLAVNKPAGMLSAPGLNGGVSLEEHLQRNCSNDNIRVVHRLDMSTSGVLLVAKSPKILAAMQEEFADRRVAKRYVALLDGVPAPAEGEIALPLAADYENRPRQRVDFSCGKQALTKYKVLQTVEYSGRPCARVAFYPITGRTHQLRVHAAYSGGLDAPIVGDELYGTPNRRLMLHAEWLSFVHPVTGERVEVECAPDF